MPKDGEPPLDLSNVKGILNGSEPVSPASMRKFFKAFEPYGLKPTAVKPSYGLAEATLFVSTTPMDEEPRIIHVDRDELNKQHFVEVAADAPNAVAQVSAGKVGVDEWAVIVDPDSASELPDGQIGEIWLHGNNLGVGYWGKEEETNHVFKNILKSRVAESHAEGAPDDGMWVRTGDFGTYHNGHLYIAGRIKDLVIIDGRNHYPQDLEFTAQEASKALRVGYVAAFSVPANPAAAEGVRRPARRPGRRPRGHLRTTGDRRRAGRRGAQAGIPADCRRHPGGDRRGARGDGARRAAGAGRLDSPHLQRQDRPPRLPDRLHRRQSAQRHQLADRLRHLGSADPGLKQD